MRCGHALTRKRLPPIEQPCTGVAPEPAAKPGAAQLPGTCLPPEVHMYQRHRLCATGLLLQARHCRAGQQAWRLEARQHPPWDML